MATLNYPSISRERGVRFWMNPKNIWYARRDFMRADHSNEKREMWRAQVTAATYSKDVNDVLSARQKVAGDGYRFIVIGDTGEGDKSQYSLIPLIKSLNADFMIINGDVAYPAGRLDYGDTEQSDYHKGLFEPYAKLGIPIWATPGNHEFYSGGEGQEFFDVFCTNTHEALWHKYGLPFNDQTRQPMSYWEITDVANKFSVLGLDTGKAANLDGEKPWWQFWSSRPADNAQVQWLRERLTANEAGGVATLVMFHIPALVNSKVDVTSLKNLHQALTPFTCVRGVIASHIHNMQVYSSQTWNRFLHDYAGAASANPDLSYIVAGAGGASLMHTDFAQINYPTSAMFPSAAQWMDFKNAAQRIVGKMGLGTTVLGLVSSDLLDAFYDTDPGMYLSLLVVDVSAAGITCTPHWLQNIDDLYHPTTTVDIGANAPPPNAAAVAACEQKGLAIHLK